MSGAPDPDPFDVPSRVQVGDLDVAYVDLGTSDGPPLVIVHGFTGHRDDFREVRDALARDVRVLIPDLRGHGDTADRPPYDFETLVRDLEGFLDALGIERCHLLGHSMGGMVTLRFALAHPERVVSSIFMNTSPDRPPEVVRDTMEKAGGLALARGMDELQRRVEESSRKPGPVFQGEYTTQRYWAHHRRRYAEMDPRAYRDFGLAMAEQTTLVPRLAELDQPALVLVGADDAGFLPGADLFERHLPRAVRVTLPGAGHHPHQETPAAWLAAVRAHLAAARS